MPGARFGLAIATLLASGLLSAAPTLAYEAGDRVVVIRAGDVMQGTRLVDRLPIGCPLVVETTNGEWLWVNDGKPGWIKAADVVALGKADEYFTRQLQTAPNNPLLFAARGQVRSEEQHFDEAIADFSEAIRLAPSAVMYNSRGIAYYEKGDRKLALADYDKAAQLDPQSGTAFYNRGVYWKGQGDTNQAVVQLDQAIRLEPDLAGAYRERGEAYLASGDIARALADLTKAIGLDAHDAGAIQSRAAIYFRQKKFAAALADIERAMAMEPDVLRMLWLRGQCQEALGHYSDAMRGYREWAKLHPDNSLPHEQIAWLAATCPDDAVRDKTVALEEAKKGCELADLTTWTNGWALETMAAAYAENGEFPSAIEYQTRALKLLEAEPDRGLELEPSRERLELYEAGKPYRAQANQPDAPPPGAVPRP